MLTVTDASWANQKKILFAERLKIIELSERVLMVLRAKDLLLVVATLFSLYVSQARLYAGYANLHSRPKRRP